MQLESAILEARILPVLGVKFESGNAQFPFFSKNCVSPKRKARPADHKTGETSQPDRPAGQAASSKPASSRRQNSKSTTQCCSVVSLRHAPSYASEALVGCAIGRRKVGVSLGQAGGLRRDAGRHRRRPADGVRVAEKEGSIREEMAAVKCRAIFAVRWYEVSRVLSVTSSLTTSREYRKETWCRRWWHISQRSLSMSARSFAPNLSPILSKTINEPKTAVTTRSQPKSASVSSRTSDESCLAPDVTVVYHRGLPRVTVPLPSRKEHCVFTLKPITHTVGDFLNMLKAEDRGIDRATVTTIDGIRIGSSNTIEQLMEDEFKLIINDNEYTVLPPIHDRHTMEDIQKLSDVQSLVCQLYEALHVREYHADMERQVMAELEAVKLELEPLEQKLQELETTAARRANLFVWTCLILMSVQFGGLARLTWWEYSWDIMEPVTYFVTYGTTMGWFIYFLLTKQEYMLPDVLHRRHLVALHKRARKAGLDIDLYNRLKDRIYELEMTLKIIRGPLYEQKRQLEMKKSRQRRSTSSSSSSSSSSASSSPSPSPSPSPDQRIAPTTTDSHTQKTTPRDTKEGTRQETKLS